MIQNTLNIKQENLTTQEDILEALTEGRKISNELKEKLSKIKININKDSNPELIEAIFRIFGEKYISRSGNSVITYDMYCSTLNLIRTLGKNKSEEIL